MHPCFGTVVDWIDDAEGVEAENGGDVHDYSAVGEAIEVRDNTNAEVHGSTDIGICYEVGNHNVTDGFGKVLDVLGGAQTSLNTA